MTPEQQELRATLGDPHQYDELRERASGMGHTVRRRKLSTNAHRTRWECTCGLYGIADSGQAARDTVLAHLRNSLVPVRRDAQ